MDQFLDLNNEFLDSSVIHDIKRLARVPLTIHEKWGQRCRIIRLDGEELVEDKVRSVAYYRQGGITSIYIEKAIQTLNEEKEHHHEVLSSENILPLYNNYIKQIRPCFQTRLESGEMQHSMRLSFLIEAYFNGYKGATTKESEELLTNLFRQMNDFKEDTTRYQVQYFLTHEPDVYPPYTCSTLEKKGFCIQGDCKYWCLRNTKVYI